MSDSFFDRLEGELAGLTHDGTHLDGLARRTRRRALTLITHGLVVLTLAVVLAAWLASEFPATAGGQMLAGHAWEQRAL